MRARVRVCLLTCLLNLLCILRCVCVSNYIPPSPSPGETDREAQGEIKSETDTDREGERDQVYKPVTSCQETLSDTHKTHTAFQPFF